MARVRTEPAERAEEVTTIEIRIPKLGMEMTEATLAQWLVDDGAPSSRTNRSTSWRPTRWRAKSPHLVAGVLRRIGEEGRTYPVGEVIGELV